MDHMALTVPGDYISCSEGLMGAYPEGNIRQFQYKTLQQALVPYWGADRVFINTRNVETGEVIQKTSLDLETYFKDPKYPEDLAFY